MSGTSAPYSKVSHPESILSIPFSTTGMRAGEQSIAMTHMKKFRPELLDLGAR